MSKIIEEKGNIVIKGKGWERIWKATGFGRPEKNMLVLTPEEALALKILGRAEFDGGLRKKGWNIVLGNKNAFKRIIALLDLVGRRGYKGHVGPEPYDISLWKRSESPSKSVPKIRVKLFYDYEDISVNELSSLLRSAIFNKKQFMIGIVDEEGDIVYYEVKIANPIGGMSLEIKGSCDITLIGDRGVLNGGYSDILESFFGKILFGKIILSPLETAYLIERGLIAKENKDELLNYIFNILEKYDPSISEKYCVFRDLKKRGHVVKSGFKYGAHFRVYKDNPDETHSNYLVNVVNRNSVLKPQILSSNVRTAHAVNKKLMLAVVEGENIEYILVEYVRP